MTYFWLPSPHFARRRFSDLGREHQRMPQQRRDAGGSDQRRYGWQFASRDYDSSDSEFATAIAAAAYAIHSQEVEDSTYWKGMSEGRQKSMAKTKTRREGTMTRPQDRGRETRRFSGSEGRSSSLRPTPLEIPEDRGKPSRQRGVQSKADAWEKAEMVKIKKWYDGTNTSILAWENEKKRKAKLQMEKRKAELEQKLASNMLHYQGKILRINQIAAEARAQADEKRRHEVSLVKENAKKIRSTGKVPFRFLCF
ncbi:Remorin, C-terminal [Dillenia turbinata]|uniref:Remorin, C-terminal n=1 Tax=Dillenia turbinata TaxID=194707 RepID=A0AAN8Z2Q6_9MAGN